MKLATNVKRVATKCSVVMGLAGLMVLSGCQSDNAMDYLPKSSGGYMAMNAAQFRESAGLKRLNDELSRLQAGSQFESEKAERMILAFDSPAGTGATPPVYGVATGRAGFADELVQEYKAAGALEGKKSGRTTYTSGSMSIAPVGDTGVLFFQTDAALARMINVSKKKEEGARTSPIFNFVNSQSNEKAFVAASVAQPLVEMGGPVLAMVEQTAPQAAAAIRQLEMISMTFDWDDNPVAEVLLHLSDKSASDSLAATINQYLTMAKMAPQLSQQPAIKQIVDPLQAQSTEQGVLLRVEVPAQVADQLIEFMSQSAVPQALPQQGFPQY